MLKAISWISVMLFGKISLLIHIILTFLAGILFSAIYMYSYIKIPFPINHMNHTNTNDLHTWIFGKIFFQMHVIFTFLACNFFQQFSWIGYCNQNQQFYFPHECQQRPRIYMCEYWCLPRLGHIWLGHRPILLRMSCCCFCCNCLYCCCFCFAQKS